MSKYEISKHLWNWILGIVKTEIPSQNIIDFNFGIFETEKGYCFYLIGSNDYDENNEDWACKSDFEPKTKYLHIQFHDTNKPDWKDFLAITEELLSNFIQSEFFTSTFFYQAKAITTGFDDGNLIKLYSNTTSDTIFPFEQLTLAKRSDVQ